METDLVNNFEPVADLVEGLTQSNTIVRRVHERESQEGMFKCPLSRRSFFYPVSGDSEVAIRVGCLPCIAGEVDLPANHLTLNKT